MGRKGSLDSVATQLEKTIVRLEGGVIQENGNSKDTENISWITKTRNPRLVWAETREGSYGSSGAAKARSSMWTARRHARGENSGDCRKF